MLIKKCFLTCALVALTFQLFAQQDSTLNKKRELYLSTSGLGDRSLEFQYKMGISNNWFIRFNLLDIFYSSHRHVPTQSGVSHIQFRHYSIDFSAGVEKRSIVNEKLTAFYGLSAISYNSLNASNIDDPTLSERQRGSESYDINPGLGFHAGFLYSLTENFYLSAELSPEFIFWDLNTRDDRNADYYTRNSRFKLSTQDILVSVVYQWDKK